MKILFVAFRTTTCIFIANILCMLLMNACRLPTSFLPEVYLFGLIAGWALSRFLEPLPLECSHPLPVVRRLVWAALVLTALSAGTRLPYLLEVPLQRLVPAICDDLWHIPEINSLVNSPAYPAQSSFQPQLWFSMYYAAWMLPAALYWGLPIYGVTIKVVLFAANAAYTGLCTLSLLYMAARSSKSTRHLLWACYLCFLWGGLNSVFNIAAFWGHARIPWAYALGLKLEFASYESLTVWVIHHLCSAVAIVMAAYYWRRSSSRSGLLICGLLLAFSFYSSIFVFIGALPFFVPALVHSGWRRHRFDAYIVATSFGLATLPLLWLYMLKPASVDFLVPMQHPRLLAAFGMHWQYGFVAGFLIFLIGIALQYAYCSWVLFWRRSKLSREHCIWIALASAYVISTYFVGFSQANNYCMRGVMIPTFVLVWICAAYLPTPSLACWIAILLGSFSTIYDYYGHYGFVRQSVTQSSFSNSGQHRADFSETLPILNLNLDRHVRSADHEQYKLYFNPEFQNDGRRLIEKLPIKPYREMRREDVELINLGPSGPWRWQRASSP